MPDKSVPEQWLEATDPRAASSSKHDRSRRWLQERRRQRAQKGVRRRLKKALQQLWDIEARLVAQGLAFTPAHRALTKAVDDLNAFLDDYNRATTSTIPEA